MCYVFSIGGISNQHEFYNEFSSKPCVLIYFIGWTNFSYIWPLQDFLTASLIRVFDVYIIVLGFYLV